MMMSKHQGATAPWKPGETVRCGAEFVTFQHLAGKAAMITHDDGLIELVPLHTLSDRTTGAAAELQLAS